MALDVKKLEEEILQEYLADDNNRPWIIGFSGGKDSTMLLQLVWNTIRKNVPPEARTLGGRPIYIICNNTLVENPKILEFVRRTIKNIRKAAVREQMPVTIHETTPKLEDSFWVNLIGKGYPAPNNMFRWCTERLKISPTTRFILDKINQHGEVIILLGTRSDESANRARSIKKYEVAGTRLRKHTLPNAYVFNPIKDVLTTEVWAYLLQSPSPWNGTNKELITLYNNSSGGDCPLVTDISSPSCGNSRFGCWVCTVVKRDRSMEALIENGEDWMQPMMEIRDYLAATINREDENFDVTKYRMPVRRNLADGPGPYWPEVRKLILEKVLRAQKIIQQEQKGVELISYQELVAIQVIWHRDFIFDHSVAAIYNEVFGKQIKIDAETGALHREKEILRECCSSEDNFQLINNLLKAQRNKILLVNKKGLQNDIENILEEQLYPTFTDVYKQDRTK
jgi:DNA sulfur modification protein DndC